MFSWVGADPLLTPERSIVISSKLKDPVITMLGRILRLTLLGAATAWAPGLARAPRAAPSLARAPRTVPRMGLFDFITDAFKNEKYDDRRATASHILCVCARVKQRSRAALTVRLVAQCPDRRAVQRGQGRDCWGAEIH